jgi:hypothetical protein
VFIADGALDMTACLDDFEDEVLSGIWTDVSTGSGSLLEFAGNLELRTGPGDGRAAVRTVETPGNVFVQADFGLVEYEKALHTTVASAVIGEVRLVVDDTPSIETDVFVRIESDGVLRYLALQSRKAGVVDVSVRVPVTALRLRADRPRYAATQLGILRAGDVVSLLQNGQVVQDFAWSPDPAAIELAAELNGAGAKAVLRTRARDYLRRPVIVFGDRPAIDFEMQHETRAVVFSPAASCIERAVDLEITGCFGAFNTIPDGFTYFRDENLLSLRRGAAHVLTICNDSTLRERLEGPSRGV